MKNSIIGLALVVALAGCSDNASPDDSQNNSATRIRKAPDTPTPGEGHDSLMSPSVGNTGSDSAGTGNAGVGAGQSGSANKGAGNNGNTGSGGVQGTTQHPNGVTDGSAVSRDTAAMRKGGQKK